ncbi:hypothetical protein KRE40_14735 [Elizabethkingia meningoseptica]|uniref:Lipoprotein n=1 Tax=Elizabethkingia meningoseptica TaxID=238 RepID=A0A1V3U0A6_ELIME|nr:MULTISPECIES: hypothetical protein [Elizabethkingia]AQX04650.1 hypothetical protein BBD33_05045 [Elizabethkingia meningoseptica]AQX12113.1 hypothetical protein BBD35_06875 [Elizabethkingia meningoseptica]AQX46692.1 hypothetical protein B5G46_05040 [Elizabethkingia meningoseptica]EJK5328396.1 hypothetical protein [Elizabethkingia meningoseptica]EOR31336.1 hypothetical protein L100_02048 [Elizabethkingia meningoseptica ATCC 13253 = NBRC 12535]
MKKSFLNIAAAAAIVAVSLVSCKKEANATDSTTDSTKVDSVKTDSTVTTTVDSTKTVAPTTDSTKADAKKVEETKTTTEVKKEEVKK